MYTNDIVKHVCYGGFSCFAVYLKKKIWFNLELKDCIYSIAGFVVVRQGRKSVFGALMKEMFLQMCDTLNPKKNSVQVNSFLFFLN